MAETVEGTLEHRFTYHAPRTPEIVTAHEQVRHVCHEAAGRLAAILPDGREKSLALTNLEQAMFWANAAIARSL